MNYYGSSHKFVEDSDKICAGQNERGEKSVQRRGRPLQLIKLPSWIFLLESGETAKQLENLSASEAKVCV